MLEFYSGCTCAVDSRKAVAECLERAVGKKEDPDCDLIIFHTTMGHDFNDLLTEMHKLSPNAQIVGCTCAGVIGKKKVSESMRALAVMAIRGEKDEFAVVGRENITGSNSRFLCRDLFTIKADRGQMEQILLNLYINAADAMPDGGSLILKTMNRTYEEMSHKIYEPRPGRYAELVVTDTGEGIDKDDMKRIFDPFFTTKEMGRGTGLGLASVYGIIKANNGYIDVESEKGEETTFKIYFPSSEEKVLKIERFAEEVIKGNRTILFIDDEEIVRDACKHMLEAIGYRVLTAGNGKEALEIYREYSSRIDIILLDMIMPGMNGSEVYDRITGINPNAKIILATGYSIDGQATEILERGCDGFIQKPFRLKDLHKKIIKVLKK